MSLLYSASEWNPDNSQKKRVSTIRKTIKHKPSNSDEYVAESENFQTNRSQATPMPTIPETQTIMDDRASRVSELLTKMTTVNDFSNSAGDKMAEFTPLENPSMNVKKDLDNNVRSYHYTPPLLFQKPSSSAAVFGGEFSANDSRGSNIMQSPVQYSNYRMTYSDTPSIPGTIASGGNNDTRLLEKINYMIRLLEEQQHEKTANITEEFILYTFLGVFVIFVLDSFARSGKYTR
jgi:hypothetical protein